MKRHTISDAISTLRQVPVEHLSPRGVTGSPQSLRACPVMHLLRVWQEHETQRRYTFERLAEMLGAERNTMTFYICGPYDRVHPPDGPSSDEEWEAAGGPEAARERVIVSLKEWAEKRGEKIDG
jgi:hypothetical protein